MTRRIVEADEWWVYTLEKPSNAASHRAIDVPPGLVHDYKRAKREFKRVQRRLARLLEEHEAKRPPPLGVLLSSTASTALIASSGVFTIPAGDLMPYVPPFNESWSSGGSGCIDEPA